MLAIFSPTALRARPADSRPGPGPLMRTSMFFTPHSSADRPACSAATWAANGVDFLDPLKPAAPEVAHARALPWRSVMVTMVLLNEAWTWAMPSATFFLTFFRTRAAAVGAAGGFAIYGILGSSYPGFGAVAVILIAALRGPLRVRA